MATVYAAVATATNHFAMLDDGSEEIYFTCTPYSVSRQVEISSSSWAETLPLFSAIEVRKRSKWDSSIQAVQEQAAVSVPTPTPPPPPPVVRRWRAQAMLITTTLCTLALSGLYLYSVPSPPLPGAPPPEASSPMPSLWAWLISDEVDVNQTPHSYPKSKPNRVQSE